MPKTKLFLIGTRHASYQFMRMDWGDGEPIVMLQAWVVSPPRVPIQR